MAYAYYDFTQADGDPSGWTFASGTHPQVKSGKLSTDNFTATAGVYRSLGFTITGDWEIIANINAPLNIGAGGVNLWLLQLATANGDGVFAGNATHVQRITGGASTNLTNDARPGSGGGGMLAQELKMQYTASTNVYETFLDGVHQGNITDATYSPSIYDTLYLVVGNTNSPTDETTIDNVFVGDGLGNTYPPTAAYVRPQLVVPRVGVQRASRW